MFAKGSLAALSAAIAVAVSPHPAAAATCADYPNQAAAQRAHDTRDADHDGIYCESLPCPCLKPGQGGGSAPKPKAAFRPGTSISFGPRTKSSACRADGPLPDRQCTPGAYFKNADRAHICVAGYTATVRRVSQALKGRVFAEYGITTHSGATYEVDHLVPLELGGSNSIANLFPEAARPTPGFHEKDRLENKAHDRVCAGARSLRATQRSIAKDWTVLYAAYFG
ncbi:MAG: hypothetical protein ACXVFN_13595 [Solirubrobacteraceae bacterium]